MSGLLVAPADYSCDGLGALCEVLRVWGAESTHYFPILVTGARAAYERLVEGTIQRFSRVARTSVQSLSLHLSDVKKVLN
jgi:hypothetical protein